MSGEASHVVSGRGRKVLIRDFYSVAKLDYVFNVLTTFNPPGKSTLPSIRTAPFVIRALAREDQASETAPYILVLSLSLLETEITAQLNPPTSSVTTRPFTSSIHRNRESQNLQSGPRPWIPTNHPHRQTWRVGWHL